MNSLLYLSRSSFRACILALWYTCILRGFCLTTLGLQLFMNTGMPSWSLIPCKTGSFNKGGVCCEEQVQSVIYSGGFTDDLY